MTGRVVDCEGFGEHFWEIVARSARPPKATEKMSRMGRGGLEKGFAAHYYHAFSSQPGAHRKSVDQIGRSRLCLNRLWAFVVALVCLFSLASVTPIGNSIQAKIFYPRKLILLYPHDSRSSAQLLWEHRTEQMFAFSLNALRQKSGGSAASKTHPRSLTSHKKISGVGAAGSTAFIEDVVILPEDLDLFIVRNGSSAYEDRISACVYGREQDLKSVPRTVDLFPDRRLGVTCMRPRSLRMQQTLKVEDVSLELDDGVDAARILPHADGILKAARWDQALVYALQSTDVDVVLYVKNLFHSRRKATEYTELENFRCRFGEAVETPVTAGANEVFRCEFPSFNHPTTIVNRVKVHLIHKGDIIPSVAYYETIRGVGPSTLPAREAAGVNGTLEAGLVKSSVGGGVTTPKKKYHVCSCTMIWNVAKFLKEWVLFNSDLGVEKFFLYDNNSEDDIRRTVSELSEYNVTRINWPWVKTQEAGFSNCAIEAQRECTWILFTDVDEYFFPKRWLGLTDEIETGEAAAAAAAAIPVSATPLASLIEDTLARVSLHAVGKGSTGTSALPALQVGQISVQCRNFGPSGRTTSPPDGVTQGYTCRDRGEQRHKSLVYFPALKSSLRNVIHHFHLKPNYETVYLSVRQAVVHHYKYQAWSEFETKFKKRASAFVPDWKETSSLNSKDRPEGVGPEPTKPPEWETSHCDMNDTSLRDYTRRRYGIHGTEDSVMMAWDK